MARYLRALPGWTSRKVATSSALADSYSRRMWTVSSVRGAGNGLPGPDLLHAAQAMTSAALTCQTSPVALAAQGAPPERFSDRALATAHQAAGLTGSEHDVLRGGSSIS